LVAASCETIIGGVVDDIFNNCVNACFGAVPPPSPGD
jgi:hypothetical protein